MSGPVLRRARPEDLAGVVDVFWRCWTATYTGALRARMDPERARALWHGFLTEPEAAPVLAVDPDGEVLGVVRFTLEDDGGGYVGSLYVRPDTHGRGLGRRLLARALEELTAAGARRARLWVFAGNAAARAFYARLGWRPSGRTQLRAEFGEPEVELTTDLAPPSFRTLRPGAPAEAGLADEALAAVDDVVSAGLGTGPDGRYPGAVVLVAKDGVVLTHRAYGHARTHDGAQVLDRPGPMTVDTAFDLASVTKVVATTAAVMRLVDEGRLDLDAPVATWVPAFAGGGKDAVTPRHLLTHTAGLWEWQPVYLHATGWEQAVRHVAGLDLRYPVGEGRYYSDLGFMLLGEVVRVASGRPLDEYVRDCVHAPLGMTRTRYRPVDGPFAATSHGDAHEYGMVATGSPYPVVAGTVADYAGWRRHTLVGEVNDGNAAHAFAGVAGHAGLFGTARDVAVLGQLLLNGGGYGRTRLFSPEVVAQFTRDAFHRGQGLGFRTDRLAVVDGPAAGGVGHGGFTGTELAVDRERGTVVVLLTNRLHPAPPHADIGPVWDALLAAVAAAVDGA